MLKKKELLKNKIIVDWIEEKKIKKMFVETIQHLCTCNLSKRGKSIFLANWNATSARLPNMEVHAKILVASNPCTVGNALVRTIEEIF